MHTQLTKYHRATLSALLRTDHTQAHCACILAVHRSTITNELARNSDDDGTYNAKRAHYRAKQRRKESKQKFRKLENDAKSAKEVERFLEKTWSPEQIAGKANLASHETIYAWISRSRPDLYVYLRRHGKKRRKYGSKRTQKQGWTRFVRPIDARPMIVDARMRIGDWEGDTVHGSERVERALTLVDRKSGYLVGRKVSATCDATHRAVCAGLEGLPCHTITFDRGGEFALWRRMEKDLHTMVCFAHAHHPWERGTNENTNGLLREFFPKGTPFATMTGTDLQRAIDLINDRPRKRLNWRTPREIFFENCAVAIQG
jgi:IS30 family transposase